MDNRIGTVTDQPRHGYRVPVYPPPTPGTNGLAIASLVVSVHGIGLPGTGVVGAILGHRARRQITRSGEGGGGLAMGGIVVGWVSTGLYVAVIAAVIAVSVLTS